MKVRTGGWRVRAAALFGFSALAAITLWFALDGGSTVNEPAAAGDPAPTEEPTTAEPAPTKRPVPGEKPVIDLEGRRAVELRVLVITTGGPDADPGLDLIDDVLETVGVPYDVLDSSVDVLEPARLADGDRGFYNGIILTEAGLFISADQPGFTDTEWQTLQDYERKFNVREAVMSGSPGGSSSTLLDYGMSEQGRGSAYSGAWVGPAGSEFFSYVNTANNLEVTDFAFVGVTRDDNAGPQVTPLLVNAANPDEVLISRLLYDDGRDVLLSTITNAGFLLHSQVLAYEFIDFATRGVHLGARRVYLNAHVDDLFLNSSIWDVENNQNSGEAVYRTTPEDIDTTVAAQEELRSAHPTLGDFRVEFAFNAFGSSQEPLEDPLTDKVIEAADSLRFLNHTFTHRDLDTSTGTTEADAYREINQNLIWWDELGLPGLASNRETLVTGGHSGLADDNGTPTDAGDDTDFPEGANPALLDAAEALGVRYLASDVSRPGQDQEVRIGDRDLMVLPRYPTGVFFDVRTPAELTDEYNWTFNESYLAQGLDPCEIPGARCTSSTYQEVLTAEAEIGLRHMLAFRQWPHYFHMPNVVDYDGEGSTLLFDWLDEVLSMYETLFVLPVESPPFFEIGERTQNRIAQSAAIIVAVLDIASGEVAVAANTDVTIEITGVAGGEPYGTQLIAQVALSQGEIRSLRSVPGPETPARTESRWVPLPGSTWQWQLSGTINTDVDVDIYDIDLFDSPPALIADLQQAGRRVICYFSAGSFEDWRPDANLFPADVIGATNGWPGERWLDIRSITRLAPILEARLDLAVQKGCDAVEPDNIDAYENESGFDIDAEDQAAFALWLAAAAQDRGLSVGMKNAISLADQLVGEFDWALNERCVEFDECALLAPFTEAGKAVFHVEYQGDLSWCPETTELGFSSLEKDVLVGPEYRPCSPDTG